MSLDPSSIAGILLRDFDDIDLAIRYAQRIAARSSFSNQSMAVAYTEAAAQLTATKERNEN